jgi:hypothetical protein
MTKPALVGPTYKIRQSAAFPAASQVLRHIREVYSQAHFGTPGQIHALESSLVNMQNWRDGEQETVWVVECNAHTAASLMWSAGDLEMRGLATPEQVAALRMAAKEFKSYLKALAEPVTAPVASILPPVRAVRTEPRPAPSRIPVSVTVAIGDARHEIVFPHEHGAIEDTAHLLSELLHDAALLMVMPESTERWTTAKAGDALVTASNPNYIALQSGIDRLLSRLRVLGALLDGGPIDPRDAPDYVYGSGKDPERKREEISIGSR